MSKFDEFCNRVAAIPSDEKNAAINDLTAKILPVLNELSEDGKSGLSIYIDFILAAVAADGRLAKEEYELIKPLFDASAEKDTTYEEAVEIFRNSGLDKPENYKNTVDLMVDLIGLVSEELKNAVVTLTLLICAIDGDVTAEEKDWIKQLVDDNFGLTPMEQIDLMLGEAGSFVLATIDDGKPRTRILGFRTMVDGKIYFAVGTFKDVYRQLQANPACEINASVGMSFLRWGGNAVFREDPRFMEAAEAAMPQVVEMYKKLGAVLAFFTIEGGSAEIVGVDNSKEKLF